MPESASLCSVNDEKQEESAMYQHLKQFWNDEEGATAVEYALIVGLIAVALITALGVLGTDIGELFGRIGQALDGVEMPTGGEG
ncbi:Flp family type IVb pilin [Paracandidimonas soli]